MVKDINISLDNLGTVNKNCVTIATDKGSVDLYFSYKTLVGVDGVCSVNDWGNTTGKLLNEIQPDKSQRKPHSEVLEEAQRRLKAVMFKDSELIVESLAE